MYSYTLILSWLLSGVLEIVIIHAKTSVGFSNISNIFENLLGPERE